MANSDNVYPNLFIIGAAKSATTTLHEALSAQPSITMSSMKEPHFFSSLGDDYQTSRLIPTINRQDRYLRIFNFNERSLYVGESSTSYLWSPVAANNIFSYNSNSKIVAILRNPVDRCLSHYWNNVKEGFENRPIERALKEELHGASMEKYRSPIYKYLEFGLYYHQISRYLQIFDKNVFVLIFEDFIQSMNETVVELLKNIKVPSGNIFVPNIHSNARGLPKHRVIESILRIPSARRIYRGVFPQSIRQGIRSSIFKQVKQDKVSKFVLNFLLNYYQSDIDKLKTLYPAASKWNQ